MAISILQFTYFFVFFNSSYHVVTKVATSFLDSKGSGQVELEKVVSVVVSKTPDEIISPLETLRPFEPVWLFLS